MEEKSIDFIITIAFVAVVLALALVLLGSRIFAIPDFMTQLNIHTLPWSQKYNLLP